MNRAASRVAPACGFGAALMMMAAGCGSGGGEPGGAGERPSGGSARLESAERRLELPGGGAACVRHDQCGSGVCERGPAAAQGQCLSEEEVVHVSASACGEAAACPEAALGTRCNPACDVDEALAMAAGRAVRLAPGLYPPVIIEGGASEGGAVRLFGPGGEDPDGLAEIYEEDGAGVVVLEGAEVVLDGLALGRHARAGVRCLGGEAPTAVDVRRSWVGSDSGTGLVAEGCEVRVTSSQLEGLFGALELTDSRATVAHSLVTNVSERPAVRVNGGQATFDRMLVAGNGDPALRHAGAFACAGTVLIRDSVLFGNLRDPATNSSLAGACALERVVVDPGRPERLAAALAGVRALPGLPPR